MKHIIHDWDDEKVFNPFPFSSNRLLMFNALYILIWACSQSEVILKATRKAMPEHAKVLLVEYVVPTGPQPCLAKAIDLRKLPPLHLSSEEQINKLCVRPDQCILATH